MLILRYNIPMLIDVDGEDPGLSAGRIFAGAALPGKSMRGSFGIAVSRVGPASGNAGVSGTGPYLRQSALSPSYASSGRMTVQSVHFRCVVIIQF